MFLEGLGMILENNEVYRILKEKGVNMLHHANTEATCEGFLNENGLLSRGYMESRGMFMTPQYSDEIDKKVDVWNDIFLDDVDIHERANKKNHYGNVLFCFFTEILLDPNFEIAITKTNPVKWKDGNIDYFEDSDDLESNYCYGTFDQMITLVKSNIPLSFDSEFFSHIIIDQDTSLDFINLLRDNNLPYIIRQCLCCEN